MLAKVINCPSTNELETASNNLPSNEDKSISVQKDERFTRINIEKQYDSVFLGKSNNTFIQTNIVKDNLLNTKVTEIKKIFVSDSLEAGVKNVIVRNIVVDKFNDQKLKSENLISFKVEKNASILDQVAKHLGANTPSPLMLN